MDVKNGPSVSSSQNKEAANGSPAQEGMPEQSSEGQNKEFSIQASATEGNTTMSLNDNINDEGGINQAILNTDETTMVLAQTKPNPSQKNRRLQKRKRPPRYFEGQPEEFDRWSRSTRWKVHFKNRKSKEKTQVCSICGRYGHKGKRCKQVRGCAKCNTKGHLEIDCPDKNTAMDPARQLCLKCGSSGHDMFSCANEYDPDDLKAISCYVCYKFGHLCCAENRNEKPAASCYNCGRLGHFGSECTQVNNIANDLQQSMPPCPKSGEGIEGMSANIHTEKEAAGYKCGKKPRRNRKRKKIKPTPIDYPSHGKINPQSIPAVAGPYYGKPGSSILLSPETAAAVASQQHINHHASSQVGNLYFPTTRPPHLIWNSQSGGQNSRLPRKQYRQAVINVHGDEAEIPGLFYRVPESSHIPRHPWSDPQVTQNSSNLSNQFLHLNQSNPRPPPIHHNATPIPAIPMPIARPLNHQTGIRLPLCPQPAPLVSHQNSNYHIGINVPRTQDPHALNHQPGIHLPWGIVHGQPPTLLSQSRSDVARTQISQPFNYQSGLLPHQIAHRQPVDLLPHQNSDNHTGSVARSQIPHLVTPQSGFVPHQIAHRQPAALLPQRNGYGQTGSDVPRTQIPNLLNYQTGFPHQIYRHQPAALHPHQNSYSETGNSGSV